MKRADVMRATAMFMAVLLAAATWSWSDAVEVSAPPAAAEERLNPHSDLIFRATGATSCRDCHRSGREGELSTQVQDNELVSSLKAKARGIHGPGRFADCLRCHAGGDKGVEKYRKP